MDKWSKEFAHLRQIFPKIIEAKMIKGIFIGPQITQLLRDPDFNTQLNLAERRAWKTFEKSVCSNFLGNRKVENWNCAETDFIIQFFGV